MGNDGPHAVLSQTVAARQSSETQGSHRPGCTGPGDDVWGLTRDVTLRLVLVKDHE